jgi:protein-tyrosine phosphatase
MSHVDLHFHLLPGVDDGPTDLQESLDLSRAALAAGTRTIVATPHVRDDLGLTDPREIAARVRELRSALVAARIPLEVACGGELGHQMAFCLRRDELDLLAQGPPDARWLLVETPFHGIGEHAASACSWRTPSAAPTLRSTGPPVCAGRSPPGHRPS